MKKIQLILLFIISVLAIEAQTPHLANYFNTGGQYYEASPMAHDIDSFGNMYSISYENFYNNKDSFILRKLSPDSGVIWQRSFSLGSHYYKLNHLNTTVSVEKGGIITAIKAQDSFNYDSLGQRISINLDNNKLTFLLFSHSLSGDFQWLKIVSVLDFKEAYYLQNPIEHYNDSTLLVGYNPKGIDSFCLKFIDCRNGQITRTLPIVNLSSNGRSILSTNTWYLDRILVSKAGSIYLPMSMTHKDWQFARWKFNTTSLSLDNWYRPLHLIKIGSDLKLKWKGSSTANIFYHSLKSDSEDYFRLSYVESNDTFGLIKDTVASSIHKDTTEYWLQCFDSNGKVKRARLIGKIRSRSRKIEFNEMKCIGDSAILIVGYANDSFDLDPSPSTQGWVYSNNGEWDGFVVWYDLNLNYISHWRCDFTPHTSIVTPPWHMRISKAVDSKIHIVTANRKHDFDLDLGSGITTIPTNNDNDIRLTYASYYLDSIGTIDTIIGPSNVCWSRDSVFTYSVPAVDNALWYDWDFPAGTQYVSKDSLRTVSVKFLKPFTIDSVFVVARRNGQNVTSKALPLSAPSSQASMSFDFGNEHICVGDSAQLSTSASGVKYIHWLNGLETISSTGGSFRADAVADSTVYKMLIQQQNTCMLQTNEFVFDVDTPVQARLTAQKAICEYTPIIFKFSGADTFSLYKNTTRIFNGTPKTFFYTKYGLNNTYWASGIDSHGCQTFTDTISVKINLAPIVNAGKDTSICIGKTVQLKGAGAKTYTWEPKGIKDGDVLSPIKTSTYVLQGEDSIGCLGYDTLTIAVNQLPTIEARNDTAICINDSVQLTAVGGVSYAWQGKLADQSFQKPTTEQWYWVIGADQNGCQNHDSFKVSINNLPPVNAGNDLLGCFGDSVRLYALNAISFKWSSGHQNGAYYHIANTDTVWVLGTDQNNCSNTDTIIINRIKDPVFTLNSDTAICVGKGVQVKAKGDFVFRWKSGITNGSTVKPKETTTYIVTAQSAKTKCTSTDSFSITVNPLPTIVAANDTAVCLGEKVTPVATGADTYNWSIGAQNEPLLLSESTELIVIGTDTNGCTSRDTMFATINPLPKPNLGNTTSMSQDDTMQFTPGSFTSYLWHDGSTDSTFFIKGREQDTGIIELYVQVENEFGCTGADTLQLNITPTSVSHPSEKWVSIYPNPANEFVFVESEIVFERFQIRDITGRVVVDGTFSNTINLAGLKDGMYQVGLFSNKAIVWKVLVVE